jgi:SAM-dependent methyltransferase
MSTADPALPPGYDPTRPVIPVEQVAACPTCGARSRRAFARGHDYELETCRNEWQFWQCSECGTVWLDPRPAVEALGIIYPPHYYAYAMSETISPIALKGKAMLDRWKFDAILKRVGFEPTSYLDIGCGDGRYLELFANRGIPRQRIYGLELSEEPVRRLNERGFNTYVRRVEDCIEVPDGTIDLATMFHVIEHVADPLRVLRRIVDWLAPGGVLAVETPNIDAWDAHLFKERWWGGYHIPRHWTLYDRDSLSRLFQEAGLEVVYTAYQTGHSFWMYSLHHLVKYKWRSPRLARWFDPTRGLPMLIAFTGFDIVRRTFGARTSAMLLVGRKPGTPASPPAPSHSTGA